MGRLARVIDSDRIERLKHSVTDPRYVEAAVERLAAILTDEIVDLPAQNLARPYRSASRSSSLLAWLRTDKE